MHTVRAQRVIEESFGDAPARRWQEGLLRAQQELADALLGGIGDGRLNRASYQHWLATESAVCRINALALDALADWHVSLPQLRATAHAWATTMRDHGLAAAADVRAIDGIAATPPSQFGLWQVFLQSASHGSRAGEALGAVVLHDQLMQGPARDAIAVVAAQPFARGGRYLLQRAQPAPAAGQRDRDSLLDAYSGAALAVGTLRAATWYRAALAMVLAPAASPQDGPSPTGR
jgi:hypothetical protein